MPLAVEKQTLTKTNHVPCSNTTTGKIVRLVRTGASIVIESQSNLVQFRPNLCTFLHRLICVDQIAIEPIHPWQIDGLDLLQKWIITGNEVITWQLHLLIEAHVCERCQAVLGVPKKQTHCWMYGYQTVSNASWMEHSEIRLCTSKWQVCNHMTIIIPFISCARIVTSSSQQCGHDGSGLIQFCMKWIEV